MQTTNAQVYQECATPVLQRALQGYNGAILAYGQTGSGKTHTVFGPPGCLTHEAVKQAGEQVPSSWQPHVRHAVLVAAAAAAAAAAASFAR